MSTIELVHSSDRFVEREAAARPRSVARRLERGRRLVVAGFAVAIVGVVAYALVCLGAGIQGELGALLLERPGLLVGPTLALIGLGTLLWLIGSYVYLNAALDAGPDGPDLDF